MKMTYASVALSAGVALGLTFGPAARAEPSARQADHSAQEVSASEGSPNDGQARIASATLKLEKAFDDQFVQGAIDRSALSGPIDDVLQAMPEAARPKVQDHIAQVLQAAEKLASEMTPAERAQATASPALETIGKAQQAQVTAWGWPAAGGWGGFGAFGFPSMFSYGNGISCNYSSQSVNGWGVGGGGCTPYGYGVGNGGWYW
jgi:hypothetical protein